MLSEYSRINVGADRCVRPNDYSPFSLLAQQKVHSLRSFTSMGLPPLWHPEPSGSGLSASRCAVFSKLAPKYHTSGLRQRKKRPLRSPEGMRLRLQGIFSCPQRMPRTVWIVSLHLFSILKKFTMSQPEPSTIVEMNLSF